MSNQITVDDLDNLRHTLGVSDKHRRGYRNYFVAGGKDVDSMERLRAAGFVIKNERYGLSADPCYHATIEGAKAVGLKALPK
jgi:cytosine/adenosine deaminase-related metal-dependent hydrolase